MAPSPPGVKVIPESSTDVGIAYRCRFFTTLTASDEEFETAADVFVAELDEWWARFTSWVGILTMQDFVGLGGYEPGISGFRPLLTWTCDATGQRDRVQFRSYFPEKKGFPTRPLQLHDLQACVAATGSQDPPPEWLFIRDARSMLNGGATRRAVIDAGTAAELAMTTLIDKYLDDSSVSDGAVRAAFGRFNNLVAKQEVLKLLRPGLLPERTRPDLIEKRNRVSHGNSPLSPEEAETAVDVATKIVDLAHPLASLLPGAQIPTF